MSRVGKGMAAVACALALAGCGREPKPDPHSLEASQAGGAASSPSRATVVVPRVERFLRASTLQVAPFVAVRADALAPLKVTVDETLTFGLRLESQTAWTDAFVSDFAARTRAGIASLKVTAGAISHSFNEAGPALVTGCVGPKELAQKSNAWELVTHCSKVLVRVGDGGHGDPGVTRKVGAPLEVLPLMSPFKLEVGDDLPARFYSMGDKWKKRPVRAYRPDGTVDEQVTTDAGLAHFRLTQPGRWVIRLSVSELGRQRTGELVFDLPERSAP